MKTLHRVDCAPYYPNRFRSLLLLTFSLFLCALPSPAGTLAKLTIKPEKGDEFTLSWEAQPGTLYQLQSSSNLNSGGTWQTIEPFTADETNASVRIRGANAMQFFRLQAQPQISGIEPTLVDSSDTNAVVYLLGQLLPTNTLVQIGGMLFSPTIIDSNGVWASVRLNGLPPGEPILGTITVIDPGTSNILAQYKLQSGFIYATQPTLEQAQGPPEEPPLSSRKRGGIALFDGSNNGISPPRGSTGSAKAQKNTDDEGGSDCDDKDEFVAATGEFYMRRTDLVVPSRGFDFVWSRTYRSRTGTGNGWDFSYNVTLNYQSDGTLVLHPGNGRADTFYPDGTNGWVRDEYFTQIRDLNSDGTPDVLFPDGGQWLFHLKTGDSSVLQLWKIIDRNTNTSTLTYDLSGMLTNIVDTLGREYTLSYDGGGHLTSLLDFSGRLWRYEYDANGDLTASVSPAIIGTPNGNDFPGGKTNRYTYTSGNLDDRLNHNLASCTDGSGQTWLTVSYQPTNNPASIDFDAVDFVQRGPYRESLRRYPQLAIPANQFTVGKAIICDSVGNVTENFYDSRQRCVRQLEYTGRSNPDLPVTESSNRPTGKLRAEDPDFYETRWEWSPDSLCKAATAIGDGNGRINRVRFAYARELDALNIDARKKGDLLVLREFACCNGADTDGDGGVDVAERAWHFEYDPRVGSPALAMREYKPTKDYLAGDSAVFDGNIYLSAKGRKWRDPDDFRVRFANMRDRINDLESKLQSIGLLGSVAGGKVGINDVPPTVPQIGRLKVRFNWDREGKPRGDNCFVTRITSPLGLEATAEYNQQYCVTKATPWKHHDIQGLDAPTLEFTYNNHGQVTAVTNAPDANGFRRVDMFTYDETGPQAGYCRQFTVDATGPTVRIYNYDYDTRGNLTRAADPLGNDYKFHNNALNQLVRVESPTNVVTRNITDYVYDAADNVQSAVEEVRDESDALQGTKTTTYGYDFLNRMTNVTEQVSALGTITTEFVYDGNGQCTLLRSPLAVAGIDPHSVTQYEYDERGLLFRRIGAPGSGNSPTNIYSYDRTGKPKIVVKAGGDPTPATYSWDYDGFGRPVSITDPMGNVGTYAYDRDDNLILYRAYCETNDVPGGAGNLRYHEWHWTYDGLNRRAQAIGLHFDPATQAPIGDGLSLTTYSYAPNGACLSVTDDNNHATRYAYDTGGRLVSITDPKTNVTSYTYDGADNVITETQSDRSDLTPGLQQFTRISAYDAYHRLTRGPSNIGNTNYYFYNSLNQCVRRIDPSGHVSFTQYDLLGRTTLQAADLDGDGLFDIAADAQQTYVYDANSRLVATIDDNTNTTSYVYDSMNRCVSIQNADNTACSLIWSPRSNLILRQDPNGTIVSNVFDLLDRCVYRSITPGPNVSTTTTFERFAYDGLSRCVMASNNVSRIDYVIDSLGARTRMTENGQSFTATHDGVGNCLSLTYPSGLAVGYLYDALDQVSSVRRCEGCGNPWLGDLVADYAYEGAGRVGRITRPNGINTRVFWNGLVNPPNAPGDFGWRQVSGINHQASGGGTTIDRRVLSYDRNQNNAMRARILPVLGGGLRTNGFAYDSMNRLTHSVTTSGSSIADIVYSLDGNGNRQTVFSNGVVQTYTMDPNQPAPADFQMNQYTLTPFGMQTYDENGNLTARLSVAQQLQYAYDYADRLVVVYDLSTGSAEPVVSFEYDALGRRISKTVYPPLPLPPETRQYLYGSEGSRVRQIRKSGVVTSSFILDGTRSQDDEVVRKAKGTFSDNLEDERVVAMIAEGHDYYFHCDELGNTLALTDSGGQPVERYEYDDYGMPQFLTIDGFPMATNTSPLGNPFLFHGMEWDGETKLYSKRWYTVDSDVCAAARRYTADSSICTAARYTGDSHICTAARYTGDSHICTAARHTLMYDPSTGQDYSPRTSVRIVQKLTLVRNAFANPWSPGYGFSAIETRQTLKTYFETGDVPTQDQFAKVPRNVLKDYFQTGDKPTQAQFVALIDSMVNRSDDRDLLGLKSYSAQTEKIKFKQEFGPTQATKKN